MSVDPAFLGRREIATAEEMEQLGLRIGEQLEAGDLLVLTGPLERARPPSPAGSPKGWGARSRAEPHLRDRPHAPSLVGGAPLVHVDAYRLGSAAELDDLDLDLERSVVVVEWGRGMAEELADSWWDIEVERPVGSSDDLDPSELDSDAPRIVTIVRESAA